MQTPDGNAPPVKPLSEPASSEVLELLQRGMDSLSEATTEEDCCRLFALALADLVSASTAGWWREGHPPPAGCSTHQLQEARQRDELTSWAHRGQLLVPVVPEHGCCGVVVLAGVRSYSTGQQGVVRKLRSFLYVTLRVLALTRQLQDATAQIQQSERLQAMGQLAGGVAHDFNNLLMVLSAAAEVAQQELGEGHPSAGHLRLILETSDRAAELSQKLLSLSRKSRPRLEVLDLHELLRAVRELLQHALDPKIAVTIASAGGACNIWADSTQLQSAILNLCLNARDAMAAGGQLSLRTQRIVLSEDSVLPEVAQQPPSSPVPGQPNTLAPGEYICLEITDTGHGMDEQTIDKIFEPFFTTKDAGQGTGLGLAVVRSTLEDHGGRISVTSILGEGSQFKLLLPLATTAAVRRGAVSAPSAVSRSLRIFLADDDADVCRATANWLRHLGHNVQAIQDSGRALRHLLSDWRSYDLLVLDLKMPAPSGAEVYRLLAEQQVKLPTVFVSGSPDPQSQGELLSKPGTVFLQKPFRKAQLETAITDCMVGDE